MTTTDNGEVAIVTGGAQGIGLAYATALARSGRSVALADLDGASARASAEELRAQGHDAIGIDVDVSDEQSVDAMAKQVDETFGRLDILVNNAAVMLAVERPFKPFWEISWDEWQRVMAVNAGGPFLCTRACVGLLKRAGGGRVVNISSDGIWLGLEGQLAYFASKGAVATMTMNMARELGQFGIRVNAIAPGLTESESVKGSEFLMSVKDDVVRSRAMPHAQQPDHLVGTLLFLCSPGAEAITGQTIVVNHGAIMR